MTAIGQDPCLSCRGRGWKFLTLRRSPATSGGTAESGLLQRARSACLACAGSGRASAS